MLLQTPPLRSMRQGVEIRAAPEVSRPLYALICPSEDNGIKMRGLKLVCYRLN